MYNLLHRPERAQIGEGQAYNLKVKLLQGGEA
jgi:hypothetical protein